MKITTRECLLDKTKKNSIKKIKKIKAKVHKFNFQSNNFKRHL